MGRAKLNMELIRKEKSRNITFKKRKEGLIRKMHEFSTLCDVDACIIIYGPRNETGRAGPEIWPQNLDEIKRMIGVYKSKSKDSGNKSFGLSDFFHDRNRKIDQDLAKLKKKNLESKYPTWPEFLNFKTESDLRALSAALSDKFEHIKSRIEFLKRRERDVSSRSSLSHNVSVVPNFYAPREIGGVELDLMCQQALSSMHAHQELLHHVNRDAIMMMNNFEGASPFFINPQIFYEPKSEIVDQLLCLNTRPVARYYTAAPVLPQYVHVMPEAAAAAAHFSNHED